MDKYVGIVVNNESISLDKIFTYKVIDNEDVKIGYRVKVPFGRGNKSIDGFIVSVRHEICDIDEGSIKYISKIYNDMEYFDDLQFKIIEFMRENYLCTYLEGIKCFIPNGMLSGVGHKKVQNLYINGELPIKYNKEPYSTIYNIISANNGKFTRSTVNKTHGFSTSSINTLIKNGVLRVNDDISKRVNDKEYEYYSEIELNEYQNRVLNDIIQGPEKIYLIHGVTGSGKTEIYMNLVKEGIKEGKECIILVPEISLTPQMVERFKGRFGRDVAVFHSRLSQGERYDEWVRVKNGEVKIAIGARSAIFLPFKKLKYVIIDEEHEGSYKSESDPKYDTREIAAYLVNLMDGKLILGSATPSIDTYYHSINGNKIKLLEINRRANNTDLPEGIIVNMKEELSSGNRSIISRLLYEEMINTLNRGEQIILFLNRRGFSTFVSCRNCGFVYKCKNCDISLTYHSHKNLLTCHYCGVSVIPSNVCPKCGSKYIKYFGTGTEKVENEIKKLFNGVKIIRLDGDTTKKKNSLYNLYKEFKEEKAQILIGTQMIAKGLDFKKVTLVGILAADLSLNFPNYDSSERTFQIITQVSGRAGRSDLKGKVIIQTYNNNNYSIVHSKNNDYLSFYNEEIEIRKLNNYPPFKRVITITLSSKEEEILIKYINLLGEKIKSVFSSSEFNILGPNRSLISKIKEMYKWQIIIKGNFSENKTKELKTIIYENTKEVYNKIKISIDFSGGIFSGIKKS